ncbi:hypothetical protein ACFU5O_29455 [Streptomyces sp. NPDC057445]|uniref:hypothetical protein n=1 Tax=Streptomyces sp. NPDC057445 TaxID=3346136 RepID=UPI003673AB88
MGSDRCLTAQEEELSGTLPDEFYADMRRDTEGKAEDADFGSVELHKLRPAEFAADAYMTWSGKVMTRNQVSDGGSAGPRPYDRCRARRPGMLSRKPGTVLLPAAVALWH